MDEGVSLRTDQIADLALYIRDKKTLELSDPGTGKTPKVCVYQYFRWQEYGACTVWVCPRKIRRKNKRELLKFTDFKDSEVQIVTGTPKAITKALEHPDAKVLIMGPHRFKLVEQRIPQRFWRSIDVDEFHLCFGGPLSKNTEAFYRFSDRAEFMVLMTGTLVNGRLDTSYAAIRAVDRRYYPLGYPQFLAQHAVTDDYGNAKHWYNHGKIRDILRGHGIRRLFSDIFGHQEIVRQVEWIDMEPKQLQLYNELETLASIEMDTFMLTTANPGVNMIRLRQLLDHPEAMVHPEGGTFDILDGVLAPKYDALLTHFEDHKTNQEPLIVFASEVAQQHRIIELAREAGLRVGGILGDTSDREADRVDQAFVRGELDCIVASPPVAGIGYNWQFCGGKEVCHVIFASLPWLDGDVLQAIRRAIRQARIKPLRVTTMAYLCKVEKKFMALLTRKSKDANKVDPTREVLTFC